MEFIVQDKNFYPLGLVEIYDSAIWTERFRDVGDFQLVIPASSPVIQYLEIGNYLSLPDSDRMMIIESLDLKSDVQSGEVSVTFKGRSLESILKRRIVWKQTSINGDPIAGLTKILNENIIACNAQTGGTQRRISNFIFQQPASGDGVYELMHGNNIQCQFTGDNVFDVVVSFCETFGIGFKVILTDSNQFKLILYAPVNRSSEQIENDPVIFSPDTESLLDSEWVQNMEEYKNVTMILGEGEGNARVQEIAYLGSSEPSGLDRIEIYTDASSVKSEREDGTQMTTSEYKQALKYKGYETLAETATTTAFDGEIETTMGPVYGETYSMGDYVSVINEYGLGSIAQITEFIRSFDSNGYSAYPTFVMVT